MTARREASHRFQVHVSRLIKRKNSKYRANNSYFCPVKKMIEITHPIAADLERFEVFFTKTLKADTEPMDSIMRYVGATKGKHLRPILVLLGARLFGEVKEETLRVAAFVEMVHNATLIHDDVVDDDDQRRGQASVKAQFGNLSAVLAGDYLLAKAMLLLMEPADRAILQEMLHTTAAMSEGELLQGAVRLSYHGNRNGNRIESGCHDVTALQTQYLDIITRKTALLIRSCCVAGALSVNATPEQVEQVSNFGLNFGILFQLRDDLLDGENEEQAQALLPVYYEKTLKALEGFAPSEITETLRDLTVFCAERKE